MGLQTMTPFLTCLAMLQVVSFSHAKSFGSEPLLDLERRNGAVVEGQPWMASNTLTPAQIKTILEMHNKYRAEVDASDMFALKWDPKLAELAQGHVNHCYTDDHTNMKLPSGVSTGQNMAMGYRTVAGAVEGWYNEINNFDLDKFVCAKNTVCGHYTQIINANSQYVGCALKTDCKKTEGNDDGWTSFTVCNYIGGQSGRAPFTKGTHCSACPAATCTDDLCDCGEIQCENGGKVDPTTCKCKCWGPYDGDTCSNENCKPDPAYPCNYYFENYGLGMCEFGNVPPKCPNRCGVCKAEGEGEGTTKKPEQSTTTTTTTTKPDEGGAEIKCEDKDFCTSVPKSWCDYKVQLSGKTVELKVACPKKCGTCKGEETGEGTGEESQEDAGDCVDKEICGQLRPTYAKYCKYSAVTINGEKYNLKEDCPTFCSVCKEKREMTRNEEIKNLLREIIFDVGQK